MSHEIEANFVAEGNNEMTQCWNCTSYDPDTGLCSESKSEVPERGHCDFFQSVN